MQKKGGLRRIEKSAFGNHKKWGSKPLLSSHLPRNHGRAGTILTGQVGTCLSPNQTGAPRDPARVTRSQRPAGRWGSGERMESPPPAPRSPALALRRPAAKDAWVTWATAPSAQPSPGAGRWWANGTPRPARWGSRRQSRPRETAPGQPSGARLQRSAARPERADIPLFRPTPCHARAQPGPAASSPRVDRCSPGSGSRTCPGAHPPCRVPARWPLPGPQAPRSPRPRGGESTGRRRRPDWDRGPRGQRGRSSVAGKIPVPDPEMHWQVQRPQLCRGLCRRAKGIYPWDPLYVLRLGEGWGASGRRDDSRLCNGSARCVPSQLAPGLPDPPRNSRACPWPRQAEGVRCSQKELFPVGSKSKIWRRNAKTPLGVSGRDLSASPSHFTAQETEAPNC